MGYYHASQIINSRGVEADITWGSGPTVTVKITGNAGYGARAHWRIRGTGSDTTRYINDTDADSGTFEAVDGESYAFQAIWGSVSDGDVFTVNFDSSSGGGSGGDGGIDWGDDDDGSGSSEGSDTCSVYASGSGASLTATVSWSSGPEVTVVVNSTTSWRLVKRGNSSDVRLSSSYATDGYTNTFNAEDGGEYIFQVYDSVDGYYTNNAFSTSGFTVNFNGSSGGGGGDNTGGDPDDSGGSGNTGNSSLKEYTFTALGVTAKATYTSGPEVTVTILSWNGYNSIPYWRIKGRASQGDTNTYLSQTNASKASFNSYDGYNNGGKEYTFQVCRNGTWGNDSGENSVFLVDFSLGGSGGSGEGGSSSPVTLYVNQGEGTKIKIIRTWSNNSTHYYGNTDGIMYENGVMFDNQIWYDGDFFEIAVKAENGYELEYYNFDGYMVPFNTDNLEWVTTGEYISDKRYRLVSDSDVTITTTATPSATARIYNNSSWNKYILHIFSNSNWNKYTPYIYKNSSWNRYS